MKKILISIGLAISLILGGTAAHAATRADSDGVILFTGNSSALGPKAKKEIKTFLDANPNAASFAVTGYVQKSGSDRNNSRLSLARANAIKKYIAKLGNTKTVTVTAGGISPTNPKSKNARKAVLTAVAPVAATPTPTASATPASYDVGIKAKTGGYIGPNSQTIQPMVSYDPKNYVVFDYVKPSGESSLGNTLPANYGELINFSVKADSNLTVKVLQPGNQIGIGFFSVTSFPSCVEFVSGTDSNGGNATAQSSGFQSVTVKVISTNCQIEVTPDLIS